MLGLVQLQRYLWYQRRITRLRLISAIGSTAECFGLSGGHRLPGLVMLYRSQ